MRALFGVVSLLIVLAIVFWTIRGSLRLDAPTVSDDRRRPGTAPPAPAVQRQLQRDVDAALTAGAARSDAAEPGAGAGDGAAGAAR